MRRPNTRTTVLSALGLAGTAGALGIALVAGPALADPAPSSSAAPSAPAAPDPSGPAPDPSAPAAPNPRADHAQRQDELAAALATELGIDKAKVAAALEKVQAARKDKAPPAKPDPAKRIEDLKTRLDAAVKAGKLTAEESAAILKAAEAGVLPGGGPHGGPGGRPGR